METNLQPAIEPAAQCSSPAEYRRIYGRSLMVLTKLREATPAQDELCRLTTVNTLGPDLWVSVQFLDGSRQSFRSDQIRLADAGMEAPTPIG
jgi:hypothetical protein